MIIYDFEQDQDYDNNEVEQFIEDMKEGYIEPDGESVIPAVKNNSFIFTAIDPTYKEIAPFTYEAFGMRFVAVHDAETEYQLGYILKKDVL